MKISGKVISRCDDCRGKGLSGFGPCACKSKRKYIVDYRVDGKRYRETIGFSKRNADARLAELYAQVHDGTFFQKDEPEMPFKVFSEKWLKDYAECRVKRSTYITYRGYIRNHLIPVFGEKDISEITQEELEGYLSGKLDKLCANTVNKMLKMLKTLFKYARRWKYIKDNPAWDIDCYREEHLEMDYLNPAEIQLVLQHSVEPYKTMIHTAVMTGMRKGELLGLQWGDIDWNSNTIRVQRSLKWDNRPKKGEDVPRWRFDTPKTKTSMRTIILPPSLKKALEDHKFNETVRLAELAEKKNEPNKSDLIFTNGAGQPIDPDNLIKRGFHPALEAAGLRKVRFHDLRHSYASLLIDQGENLKFIQSQLGHASIQTTIDRYGHMMHLGHYADVGVRLDEKVFAAKDEGKIEEVNKD